MSDTKNELNDIILNKSGNDFSGIKKVLLAVATFAVLLIIVVVIMSAFSDDQGGVANQIDENTQRVLPPQPDAPELFKPAQIVEENSSVPTFVPETAPSQEPLSTPVTTIEDPYEPVTTTPLSTESQQEQPVQTPPAQESKPVAVKPTPKPLTKPVTKPTSSSKEAQKNLYYLQVGSFQKGTPNAQLLKKITSFGYSYYTQRVTVRDSEVTKLLIGPFETYHEAKEALPTVAKQIEKNAFIYRAK
ncbi:MAG: hypothetical protein KU37_09365 [Sulfuricurvum sp. PC08-66]|nr:MAG: hypothetical protein KU37_09365 [Sulfuricurvum sp. PC08-66]